MVEIIQIDEYCPSFQDISMLWREMCNGKILAIPTHSGYSLVLLPENRSGIKSLQKLFSKEKKLPVAIYKDVSYMAKDFMVSQSVFKLLKKNSPSSCTFIIAAAPAVSAKIIYERRAEIGIKFPDEPLLTELLKLSYPKPLVSFGLVESDSDEFAILPHELSEKISLQDLVIVDYDRPVIVKPSTIVDCCKWPASIIRQGDFCLQ